MYSKITATNKHIMPIIADTIPIALVATPIFALAKVNTVETRKSGATSVGNLEVRRKGTSERKGISEKKTYFNGLSHQVRKHNKPYQE
jgi:hypothetical protein